MIKFSMLEKEKAEYLAISLLLQIHSYTIPFLVDVHQNSTNKNFKIFLTKTHQDSFPRAF